MRKCPNCQTVYGDDTLAFCLSDGAALLPVRDPEETLTGYDPNATLAYPPAQATNRTLHDPRQAARMVVPLNTTPPAATTTPPSNPPPQVIKQGVSPVIVGVLAGLLVLAMGTIAAFMFSQRWATPSENANAKSAPTPVAETTPQTQPTVQREVVVVRQPVSNVPQPQPTQNQPPAQPPPVANTNTAPAPADDLAGQNCYQLKIRRNTIFARHGYIFKTPDMIDYFSRQPWYNGTRDDVSGLLSPAEKRAVARLQRYENSLGCR